MQEARAWQQRRRQQHQPPLPLLLESPDQLQPLTMSNAAANEMAMAETEGTGFGTVT